MVRIAIALLALSCFGGQSIVSTTSDYPANYSVPNAGHSTALRIEFQLHDWTVATTFPLVTHAFGFYGEFVSGGSNGLLFIMGYWDSTGATFIVPLPSVKYMNVRIQRDPTALTQSVEAWDVNGLLIYQSSKPYVDLADTTGGVQVGNASVSTAFFRVHSTLVAMGSRPPVTADHANTLLEWKFDGNLSDSGPGGYAATMTAPSYVTTPYQVPVSIPKVYGSPVWTNSPSLRAGYSNKLDCGSSYSEIDASASVACAWTGSGASTPTFDNAALATPTVTGLVFGEYSFGLTVTDTASQTASASLTVGSVVTDDNWIIQSSDPNVEKILGKQIAWGHSPWGRMDERAMKALGLQTAYWTSLGINPPPWKTPLTGTVTYRFGGNTSLNSLGTTLTTGINATDLTIVVASVTNLDLTVFPTRLLLSAAYATEPEEVRICSAVGTTLTVCSGGRASYGTASSWGVGTQVGQMKVVGSGTDFLSTFCSGSHPTWKIALHYNRADSSDGQMTWSPTGCESNTALYLASGTAGGAHDVPALDGTVQSGKAYSYADSPAYTGAYNPNFYGTDLAFWRLYFRSGLTAAKTAAKTMSEQWINSPYVSGGDGFGQSPLLWGGAVIGAIASKVLDSTSTLAWSDVRAFCAGAVQYADVTGNGACSYYDTRDSGYELAVLPLCAMYEPTTPSTWLASVQQSWTREQTCKGSDNSWANAGYKWGTNAYPLTATNGSAVLTATALPTPDHYYCNGAGSGTSVVTNGSEVVTGIGFSGSYSYIIITGTRGGSTYSGFFEYSYNSPTSITISGLWPGDSGSATYLMQSSQNFGAIGTDLSDSRLQNSWGCTYDSSTQITLHRPWVKAGGGSETVYLYGSNLPGFNQQPYMMGIKATQIALAAKADVTHDWAGLGRLLGTWVSTYGVDPVTKGLYYGRVAEACEPITAVPTSPAFFFHQVGCSQGLNPGGIKASRVLTAEGMAALIAAYDGSPAMKAAIDQAYGALWGDCSVTTGGVYCDANFVTDENADGNLGTFKWTGFFFGMGASEAWPAIRGGVPFSGGGGGGGSPGAPIGGRVQMGGRVKF